METGRWMFLARRVASVLIALCFILPLSQCDSKLEADGKTVTKEYQFAGIDLAKGALTDIGAGHVANGLGGVAISVLVFFLPLASWKMPDIKQAMLLAAAAPPAGFFVYVWSFGTGGRTLFGGYLLTTCWALVVLSACVSIGMQAVRWRRRPA